MCELELRLTINERTNNRVAVTQRDSVFVLLADVQAAIMNLLDTVSASMPMRVSVIFSLNLTQATSENLLLTS